MGVRLSATALGRAGQETPQSSRSRGDDQGGLAGAHERFRGGGVRGVTRRREVGPGDPEEPAGAAAGNVVGRGFHARPLESDRQARSRQCRRQRSRGVQGFQRGLGQRAIRFRCGEKENGFHG